MKHELKIRNGILSMGLGVVLLGVGPILVKTVNANGLLVAFYRLLFGGIFLTVPALLEWKREPLGPGKNGWGWAIGGSLMFGFNMALWCTALNFTTASAATLLDNIAPVWVALFGLVFLGKKYPRVYWLGLAATLIGAAMIVGFIFSPSGGALSEIEGNAQLKGNLIALLSGVAYAAYIILTHQARVTFSAVKYSWLVCCFGALGLFFIALFTGQIAQVLPMRAYLLIALIALISQVIAWVLVNHALGVLPQAAGSVALTGQSVIATALGALLIGETLTLGQALGGVICLSGILIVQLTIKT